MSPEPSFGKSQPRRVRSLDDYIPSSPLTRRHRFAIRLSKKYFPTKGVLGRLFPGYEQREPQVTMSTAVAEAFNTGNHVIVEAGTGTGKGSGLSSPLSLARARTWSTGRPYHAHD
jgi:hypothetical protein